MKMVKFLMLLPIPLLMLTPAHATAPTLATGNIIAGPGSVTDVRAAGNNTFAQITAQVSFAGGINGTGLLMERLTLHNSTDQLSAVAQIAFTGTVLGSQPGSMNILFVARATLAGPCCMSLASIEGQLVLRDGTAGLAGVHGEGTIGLDTHITYSMLVHFDPA